MKRSVLTLAGALCILAAAAGCKKNDKKAATVSQEVTNGLGFSGQLAIDNDGVEREVISTTFTTDGKVDTASVVVTDVESVGTFVLALGGNFRLSDGGQAFLAVRRKSASFVDDATPSEKLERYEDFISITTESDALSGIPTSDMTDKAVDLGLIEDGKSETTLDALADNFQNTSLATLTEQAQIDNGVLSFKNALANSNPETGDRLDVSTYFLWQVKMVANQEIVPDADDTKLKYAGYGIGFQMRGPAVFDFEKTCKAASDPNHLAIELYPPETIKSMDPGQTAYSWGPTTPLSNGGVSGTIGNSADQRYCNGSGSAGDIYVAATYTNGQYEEFRNFNWGAAYGFADKVAKGVWLLKAGGSEIGAFDLAATSPFNADGKPYVYLPKFTIVADDSTGVIQRIDLVWMLWNPATQTYDEVTEFDAMFKSTTEMMISFTDLEDNAEGRLTEIGTISEAPASGNKFSFTPTETWYLWDEDDSNNGTKREAQAMSISYVLNGLRMNFDIRKIYK